MNFAERPASKQWAGIPYQGKPCAEVWFKPEGEPNGLTFRIPVQSFSLPGLGPRLTPELLLKAVGLAPEEVAAWHCDEASPATGSRSSAELRRPLPSPPAETAFLQLHVRLKQLTPGVAPTENRASALSEARWQELETRWNSILALEVNIDQMRISVEAVKAELEAASKQQLRTEERVNASNADVAQWNKAKSRVVFALPKAREYIHRATWATSTPERKKLEELYKTHIHPRLPFPELDRVGDELHHLLKDRQVLAAHGVGVNQECRNILAEIQSSLRTLLNNSAANAHKKRLANNAKGKYT